MQNDNTNDVTPMCCQLSALSGKSLVSVEGTSVQEAGANPPVNGISSALGGPSTLSSTQSPEPDTETASFSSMSEDSSDGQKSGSASNFLLPERQFSLPLGGITREQLLDVPEQKLNESSLLSGSLQPEEILAEAFVSKEASSEQRFTIPGIGNFRIPSPPREMFADTNPTPEVSLEGKAATSLHIFPMEASKNFNDLLRSQVKRQGMPDSLLLKKLVAEETRTDLSTHQNPTFKVKSESKASSENPVAVGSVVSNASPIINSLKELDLLVKGLPLGSIAFNVPNKMDLDESTELALTLSLTTGLDDLRRSVMFPQDKGTVESASVRVTDRMEARLTGNGFQITAITPELQAVIPSEATTWKWLIKAAHPGKHDLHLTVSALVEINKSTTPFVSRTFDKTITVEITWQKKIAGFTQENWQWIWGAVGAPVGVWFFNRYRKPRPRQRDIDD